MSVITSRPFQKGQKNLSASHMNDIQMAARQIRKGINVNVDGGIARSTGTGTGNQIQIEVLPTLYKVVSVSDSGNSSSSSSDEGGVRHAYVQQVDVSTGTTYGPVLRVEIA